MVCSSLSFFVVNRILCFSLVQDGCEYLLVYNRPKQFYGSLYEPDKQYVKNKHDPMWIEWIDTHVDYVHIRQIIDRAWKITSLFIPMKSRTSKFVWSSFFLPIVIRHSIWRKKKARKSTWKGNQFNTSTWNLIICSCEIREQIECRNGNCLV